jgi:hypothetical protein
MKIIIISLFLIISVSLNSQKVDNIRVYAVSKGATFLSEKGIDADYVRSRYDNCFETKERAIIDEVKIMVENMSLDSVITTRSKWEVESCRVVIDLISASRIQYSVVFNNKGEMFIEEPYDKVRFYPIDKDLACYLALGLPYFFDARNVGLKCGE